jgi:TolA-binding protein
MTNEEFERAIDFILKSQARAETRVEWTEEQLRQLTEQVSSFAGTQANIMRVMTQTFEAQARINEDLREGQASVRTAIVELAGRQSRTEEALARLAETQSNSDRRLDALIKVVEGGRGGGL